MTDKKLTEFKIDSSTYLTSTTKKYDNRKRWETPNPKLINSYIPGTIKIISVKVGDSLNEGDDVLILEAMKMRNRITMPFDGKIKAINIVLEQKIPKNYCMIEIE